MIFKPGSQRQRQLLKEFSEKLAHRLNELTPELAKELDYAMVAVPLVALAVSALKQRGMTREAIEDAVMEIVDKQFTGPPGPQLTIVR